MQIGDKSNQSVQAGGVQKSKKKQKIKKKKTPKPAELTAGGRKKLDTSSLSGEKKGSNPINFGSWGNNLKSGKSDSGSTSQLQESLNKGREDGKKLAQDGKFGKQTCEAVKQFQKDKGLKVDGIVGKYTKAALERQQNAGSKDPNTTIPSGGIDELNKAVKQQQQGAADLAKGQTGGGLNQLRGVEPSKANAEDRATAIPKGESATFPEPGIGRKVQEGLGLRPSGVENAVPRQEPKVDSVGPMTTVDGMPTYAFGA